MNALVSTPAEPEEANDHAPTTKHCAVQAVFWISVRAGFRDGLSMLFLVERAVYPNRGHTSSEYANHERYECETRLRGREGVWRALEHIRKSCKEQEQHCERETGVEREEEHYGLFIVS